MFKTSRTDQYKPLSYISLVINQILSFNNCNCDHDNEWGQVLIFFGGKQDSLTAGRSSSQRCKEEANGNWIIDTVGQTGTTEARTQRCSNVMWCDVWLFSVQTSPPAGRLPTQQLKLKDKHLLRFWRYFFFTGSLVVSNTIKYKKVNIKTQKYILYFEIASFKHWLTRLEVNSSGEFSGNRHP